MDARKNNRWPIEVEMQEPFPMQSLSEGVVLSEISFDIHSNIPIHDNGTGIYEAEMETDDGTYRVHFWQREPDKIEITFRLDIEKLKPTNFSSFISNFDSGLETTNNGDPIRVFSFVISAVVSFIKRYDPPILYLVTREPKKIRTYKHLIDGVSNKTDRVVRDKKIGNVYSAVLFRPDTFAKYNR